MFHCLPLPRGVGTARPHFPPCPFVTKTQTRHPNQASIKAKTPTIKANRASSRQTPNSRSAPVLGRSNDQTAQPHRHAQILRAPAPRNPRPGSRDPFTSRPIKANRASSRQMPFFETTCMLANQTTGLDGPSDEYRNVCQEEILSWGERTKVRASVPQNCLAASPHPPIKAKNPVIVHNQGISRQPVKILNPTFRPRHPNVPAPGSSMLDVLAKKPAPHQSVSR